MVLNNFLRRKHKIILSYKKTRMGTAPQFSIYPSVGGGGNGSGGQLIPSLNGGTLKITARYIRSSGGSSQTPMVVDGGNIKGNTYKFTLSDNGKNVTLTGTYQGIEAENISGILNVARFDNVIYSPVSSLYINGSTLNIYLP